MIIIIYGPNQKIGYTQCTMVKGYGKTGQFVLLPNHENFITLLVKGNIYIKRCDIVHIVHIVDHSVMQYIHDSNICQVTTPYCFIKATISSKK